MVSEIEVKPGEISSMRVTVKSVRRASWVAILYGIGLSFAMLYIGGEAYQLVPVCTICIASGFGTFLGATGFKALQSKYERQVVE